MKLQLKTIVLTAGLSALLGTVTLAAQSLKAVATIPFSYNAGQTSFDAGKYMISETGAHGLFQIRETATSKSIFVSGVPDKSRRDGASKLVFSCYAGECSLSQIWMQGDSYKLTLPRVEREASNRLGVAALVSVPLLSH